MRDNGGHAPQLGSCTLVRSIYYNQHTRIFGILSAEHLATPRSVRFRPIISGTCYTPRREVLPPLRLIRDVGVSIRSVSVWAGLFSPLKIGPVIRRNRGGLASRAKKTNRRIYMLEQRSFASSQENLHASDSKQCGRETLNKYHHSFCCDYPLRLNFQDMKIHAKEIIINQQVYCCGKSS